MSRDLDRTGPASITSARAHPSNASGEKPIWLPTVHFRWTPKRSAVRRRGSLSAVGAHGSKGHSRLVLGESDLWTPVTGPYRSSLASAHQHEAEPTSDKAGHEVLDARPAWSDRGCGDEGGSQGRRSEELAMPVLRQTRADRLDRSPSRRCAAKSGFDRILFASITGRPRAGPLLPLIQGRAVVARRVRPYAKEHTTAAPGFRSHQLPRPADGDLQGRHPEYSAGAAEDGNGWR